jgi:hypothetical protein
MSKALLILGDSGSGKTASLMNLEPFTTLLIQSEKKDLPFRPKGWGPFSSDPEKGSLEGSINVSNDYQVIKAAMGGAVKAGKKVIIIDDANYLMMGEEFRRVKETGFGKFSEMALHFLSLVQFAKTLPDDVIVVIMAHSQTSPEGKVSIKTTGKMLDEKVIVEGLFTMVMMCKVREGKHYFETKTNGNTPAKMPIGMFDSNEIDNDLKIVVETINDYYTGE